MSRVWFLAATLLLSMAVPSVLTRLEMAPRWKARLAFLALAGITATSAAFLAALFLPEVLSASGLQQVWALCSQAFRAILRHPLERAPSVVAGVALAVVLGRLFWSLLWGARTVRRARICGAEPACMLASGAPVYVVPIDHPEAYSVGARRGQVVVSRGLLEFLDTDERRAVLLHEEGHLRARHQKLLLLGRACLSALKPLPPAEVSMALLERAVEESADEYAASKLGTAGPVATGLTKVALAELRSPVGAVALSGTGDVPARVRRLLDPPIVPSWVPAVSVVVAGVLLGLVAVSQAIAGVALLAAAHHVLGFGVAALCPFSR